MTWTTSYITICLATSYQDNQSLCKCSSSLAALLPEWWRRFKPVALGNLVQRKSPLCGPPFLPPSLPPPHSTPKRGTGVWSRRDALPEGLIGLAPFWCTWQRQLNGGPRPLLASNTCIKPVVSLYHTHVPIPVRHDCLDIDHALCGCVFIRAVSVNALIYAINAAAINAIKYFNAINATLKKKL